MAGGSDSPHPRRGRFGATPRCRRARVSCSPIRPLRSRAAPGHGGLEAREPAPSTTGIRSDQRTPSEDFCVRAVRAVSRCRGPVTSQ
jgi:hypothetical protein